MAYAILFTINLSTLLNSAFIIYLWSRLYSNELIKYETPIAYATTPNAPLKLT